MITQSLALYEVWSLCGAQICSSKFFLFFFFTKTQKTHRCTFATDAGRRLRTTRTSLDVDISSVRLPFSSVLLFTTLAKVFLFLVSRFVVVLSFSLSLLLLLLTHILLLNRDAFYSRKQTTGEEDIQRVLSSGECPICQKAVLERHVKQTPLVLEEEKVQVQNVFVFLLLCLLCLLCLLLLQNTHTNNNNNK